jgi:hypothetical protein
MPNVIRSLEIPAYIYEAYNTQAKRRPYPDSNFLLVEGGNKKFPYRDPKTGALHCGLIRAAMSRAGQFKYESVLKKATSLYNNNCKKQEKAMPISLLKEISGEEILGIVASPDEKPDIDGDVFDKEAIKEACHDYNVEFRQIALHHGIRLGLGEAMLLESYTAPSDFTIKNGDKTITVKEGTWLQRWRILNEGLKEEIKQGKLKGLSLGGFVTEREPI